MATQEKPTFDELSMLLGSALGVPVESMGKSRTWTFTPKMKSPPWPLWCSALPADVQIEIFRAMILARLRAAGFVEVT